MTGSLGGMTSTLEMAATTAACRIEMDDNWYLVGVPKIRLDGLTVRADRYE